MTTQFSTATPRMSISKAHDRIKNLGWESNYFQQALKYPTDYSFTKAPKDVMKQVMRSYLPMQEEKDNRVYGAMDAALRGNMFSNINPRWIEWMKAFLLIIPGVELSAGRSMALLSNVVPSDEIKSGLALQLIDEVRHSNIQQNLKKWYMENYIDPAGFDVSQVSAQRSVLGAIGRQFGEFFITGDAVTASCMFLQVVAETSFTNTLFVAMPSEAAANGDYALPSIFMSVQSDESRHINNGYCTLIMALADPENRPLLERDLRYAFWLNHCINDALIGSIIEYATKDRRKDKESFADLWKRWIYDDYYRSYLLPLEKYGLKVHHEDVEAAWDRITKKFWHHRIAQSLAATWSDNTWRIDPLDERDFEWFEHKYPGWYNKFGRFWEVYRELSKPGMHISSSETGWKPFHRCNTCLSPIAVREDIIVDEVNGEIQTYCSEQCHWVHKYAFQDTYEGKPTPSMGRLSGKRNYEENYHGWDYAAALKDMGNIRQDGKTLIAQPHLHFDDSQMWTTDHLKGAIVQSPLLNLRNMTPEQRKAHIDDYKKGFTIH